MQKRPCCLSPSWKSTVKCEHSYYLHWGASLEYLTFHLGHCDERNWNPVPWFLYYLMDWFITRIRLNQGFLLGLFFIIRIHSCVSVNNNVTTCISLSLSRVAGCFTGGGRGCCCNTHRWCHMFSLIDPGINRLVRRRNMGKFTQQQFVASLKMFTHVCDEISQECVLAGI